LTALATVGLVVVGVCALGFAYWQLEDFRKESRIKHLIELVDQFEQDPWAAHRRKLGEQRTSNGTLRTLDLDAPPYELHDILNFFEHMGYLLSGDYVDLDGVFTEFHYWIFHVWADAKELVKHEQADTPVYYENLAKMVGQLVKIEVTKFGKFEYPSQEEITDFYLEEARSHPGIPIQRQRRKRKLASST
jgi:hypothetical protein